MRYRDKPQSKNQTTSDCEVEAFKTQLSSEMEFHNSMEEEALSPVNPQKDIKLRYQKLQDETDKLRISLSKEQEYSRGLQEGITELRKELLETQQKLQTRYMERRMDRTNEARSPRDIRRMPATVRMGNEYYRDEFHHFRLWAGSRHGFTVPDSATTQRPSHIRPFHRRSDKTSWRHGHTDNNHHISSQMLRR